MLAVTELDAPDHLAVEAQDLAISHFEIDLHGGADAQQCFGAQEDAADAEISAGAEHLEHQLVVSKDEDTGGALQRNPLVFDALDHGLRHSALARIRNLSAEQLR